MSHKFYGLGIPGVHPEELPGTLVVLEGADGSGRSTQIEQLREWLETLGYATADVGLNRSRLVSPELSEAKEQRILGPITRSLFYATDFADQLENIIIPALRSGHVVLCDRYIYTLVARDTVRGAHPQWVESLYGIALVPDLVFYLRVSPLRLLERTFMKRPALDYWEAGMDLGLSRDIVRSFVRYQRAVAAEFTKMQERYDFKAIDGNRSIALVFNDLRSHIATYLEGVRHARYSPPRRRVAARPAHPRRLSAAR